MYLQIQRANTSAWEMILSETWRKGKFLWCNKHFLKTYRHLYTVTFTFTVVSGPTGACIANKHYIEQLEETFATSVPSQIAAFFGEPIQVYILFIHGYGWIYFWLRVIVVDKQHSFY